MSTDFRLNARLIVLPESKESATGSMYNSQ